MKLMKKQLLISCFLLTLASMGAQTPVWTINGLIQNEAGAPLPGAFVQLNDTLSAVADEEGLFTFSDLKTRPNVVIVRHTGYFPSRTFVQLADFKKGKASLGITLMAQETALKEVEITGKRVQKVVEEDFTMDILDYEFVGDKMLLLVRHRKKYLLQLVNDRGEVFDDLVLPYTPVRLFRSCFRDLHVVGQYEAQEVTLAQNAQLDTFPRYSIQKFKRLLEPCVAEVRGTYFFKSDGFMKKSIHYWYVLPDGSRHLLRSIVDEKGEAEARDILTKFNNNVPMFVRDIPWGVNETPLLSGPDPSINSEPDMEALLKKASGNNQIALLGAVSRVRLDSIYIPLLLSRDTLFLFDHLNGELTAFRHNGDVFYHKNIAYQQEKGWSSELLYEAANAGFYAHFVPGGHHHIRKIDPQTGTLGPEIPLDEVNIIAKKFKIRNGYLYCLDQKDLNVPNYSLLKVDLKRKPK